MKISVLGAGNAGCATAADLTLKGHEVTLIKTSHALHDDNFEYLLANNGAMTLDEFGDVRTALIHKVTRDVSEISGSKIVIMFIQTKFHEQLIERIEPYLCDGQILLIIPGYLSTAYVLKHCKKDIVVAEGESSFVDGRILELGRFRVGFRNVRNPVGVYPKAKKDETFKVLEQLNERIVPLNSVVEAALHNPNVIVHTVGTVMSIPWIEKTQKEFCLYHDAYARTNVATWRVLEALDSEKMDIIEKLGFERLSYVEACKYRNSLDSTIDGKEVFLEYAEMPIRSKGPAKVESRYITEDVPQGLVMLEALGKALGVATPIATSLIEIASAALGRDLRKEGRTPHTLGEDNIKKIINDCKN